MTIGTEGFEQAARKIAAPASGSLLRRHSDAANRALLQDWLPDSRTRRILKTDLFDEACTEGLIPVLRERGEQVVGIDLEAGVAARARRRLAEAEVAAWCLCADVRALPFASGSFDVVVSNSTLDHFSDAREIDRGLEEIARVLAPGGELVVTLDNPRHPLVALRGALPLAWLRRARLVPYFVGATLGPSALARALERSGFELREMRAVVHFPRIVLEAVDRIGRRALPARALDRLVDTAATWERLDRLPTRFFTGHFIAARARRL